MSDLAAFQQAFIAAMRERIHDSSASVHPVSALHAQILPVQQLTPEQALQVYSQDYRVRLTEVLRDQFSAVHFILGDAEFLTLARDFIYAQPSRDYDLGQYGALLPAFIAAQPNAHERPFLAELSALEWELNQVFHQAVLEGNDLSQMQSCEDPGALRFAFIPSLRLWQSQYALFDLWQIAKNPDKTFEIHASQSLITYKSSQGARVSRLKGVQIPLLENLLAGQPLDQALNALETNADSGVEIAELFALLKQEALVAQLQD